jgi:autotransporter-associated beta strand protein
MSALVLIRSRARAAALVVRLFLKVSLLHRLAIEVTSAYLVLASMVAVHGAPLDPNAFTSLGTLDVSAGTITINTDTLAISGAASFTGVAMPQSGGPEIAVFTFDGIDILAGATIAVSGTRPLALLSQGDITIDTRINLNGGNSQLLTGTHPSQTSLGGVGGPGGGVAGGLNGCPGSTPACYAENGEGPGGGAAGYPEFVQYRTGGGGGGFGGSGGVTQVLMPSAATYGDLFTRLEAGSGGGGGGPLPNNTASGYGGGGGAGAIEIGAVQNVYLGQNYTGGFPLISAIGGRGSPQLNSAPGYHGGGGSGGGVLIHGSLVSVAREIYADGGGNLTGGTGGGGGGGRIAILGLASYQVGTTPPFFSAYGGVGIESGNGGVISFQPHLAIIPEGQLTTLDGAPTVAYMGNGSDQTIEVLIQRDLTILSGGQATLGASDVLEPDSALAVEGVGVFDAGNYNQTVGSLSGDGEVRIGGGGSLTVGFSDATSIFGGRINGAGSLRKMGAGSLEVVGASNYTGTTYVDQGTLSLTNSLATLGGPIEIASDGIFEASGIVQRSPIGTGGIAASATLLIGDVLSASGFQFGGSLNVGSHTVQLLDGDAAHLGSQTTLAAGGRLGSLNGMVMEASESLTAAGSAEVDGAFTNDGTVNGPTAAGQFLTFTDDVDGAGSYTGNVLFSDGFSPDNNLAAVSLDNIAFDAGAELRIDLGGLLAGEEFDQLNISGAAGLGGALAVNLVEGFLPSPGQSFTILTADAVEGMFTTEMLPSVTGLIFDVIYNPQSVVLTVSTALTADFDQDGDVDSDDLDEWQVAYGVNALGDADADGDSDGRDFLAWQRQFGSGVTPLASSQAVPEPTAWVSLIAVALLGWRQRFVRRLTVGKS